MINYGSTTANALATTGAAVQVSTATAPVAGQVLTATSATAANWQTPASGGVTKGSATVNFGSFPGASDTSVAVTGQTGIVASSFVSANIIATASSDHSADEHWVEEISIRAGNIVAGTGFTIYARTNNVKLYGQWNVVWAWS